MQTRQSKFQASSFWTLPGGHDLTGRRMFPRTRKFHPWYVGFLSDKSASFSKRKCLRSPAPAVSEAVTRFAVYRALGSRQGQLGNQLACIDRTQPRRLGVESNTFSSTLKNVLRAVSKPEHSGVGFSHREFCRSVFPNVFRSLASVPSLAAPLFSSFVFSPFPLSFI